MTTRSRLDLTKRSDLKLIARAAREWDLDRQRAMELLDACEQQEPLNARHERRLAETKEVLRILLRRTANVLCVRSSQPRWW